jgi:hypothetical protein
VTTRHRRIRLWLVAIVVVAAGVAVSTIATLGEGPEDELCPERAFGCVETGPGGPIRIATLLPLSGLEAETGQLARRGAELALELEGRPVLGHDVVLVHRDDRCSPEAATSAARLLAIDTPDEPPVAAVVGAPCARTTEPAAQILSDSGIPLVTWSKARVEFIDPPPERSFFVPLTSGPDVSRQLFQDAYIDRYGAVPENPSAFEAFRATSVVLRALEAVARPGATRGVLVPRVAFRDALRRLAG